MNDRWQAIRAFSDRVPAEAVANLLRAEGVPVDLKGSESRRQHQSGAVLVAHHWRRHDLLGGHPMLDRNYLTALKKPNPKRRSR